MKKSSLSLILAGAFAVAGAAHAQNTWDTPQQAGEASTMSQGAPNLETDTSSHAGTVTTTTTIHPSHTIVSTAPAAVYVQPSVSYAPDTVVLAPHNPMRVDRNQSAATFNVPSRAGEASTMTGGAPNMVTDNARVIHQQSHLYSSVSPADINY